ncbi:MAG: hypothetical protein JWN36_2287, partial [Microbacteriaceae bacterium]|nr:hypothetical protein [Microbacteriaceae bacterium]
QRILRSHGYVTRAVTLVAVLAVVGAVIPAQTGYAAPAGASVAASDPDDTPKKEPVPSDLTQVKRPIESQATPAEDGHESQQNTPGETLEAFTLHSEASLARGNAVADARALLSGRSLAKFGGELWVGMPSTAAELQKSPLRVANPGEFASEGMGGTIGGLGFAQQSLSATFHGDIDPLTLLTTSSGLAAMAFPDLGMPTAGLQVLQGFLSYDETGNVGALVSAIATLVSFAFPELLGPVAMAIAIVALWAQESDIEPCLTPAQQVIDAYQGAGYETLRAMGDAAAKNEARALETTQEQIQYRATYAQSRIVLDALAQGYTRLTFPTSVRAALDQITDDANAELDAVRIQGTTDLNKTLLLLQDEINNGQTFKDFEAEWLRDMNDSAERSKTMSIILGASGVLSLQMSAVDTSSCGAAPRHIDASELPATNTQPITIDTLSGAAAQDFGSVRTEANDVYTKAYAKTPLYDQDTHTALIFELDPQDVLDAVTADVTTPSIVPAVNAQKTTAIGLGGTGKPGTFIEVFDAATNRLVCSVTGVNEMGLWRCDYGADGFQRPGTTVSYALYSSAVSTGGFTPTGTTTTLTTAPLALSGVATSGRTVSGVAVPAGATEQLRSTDGTGGTALSEAVTAGADGSFSVTASPSTLGGGAYVVSSAGGSSIASAVTLAAPPPAIPVAEIGSIIQLTAMGSNSISGITGIGYQVHITLDSNDTYGPITADGAGAFSWTSPVPLTTRTLISIDTSAPGATTSAGHRAVVYSAGFSASLYVTLNRNAGTMTAHVPAGHTLIVQPYLTDSSGVFRLDSKNRALCTMNACDALVYGGEYVSATDPQTQETRVFQVGQDLNTLTAATTPPS